MRLSRVLAVLAVLALSVACGGSSSDVGGDGGTAGRSQCEGTAASCLGQGACTGGYERFEYAPGCCACRVAKCAETACTAPTSCPSGEALALGGCCGVCRPSTCDQGAAPCDKFQCPAGYAPFGISADGPGCCSSCEPDPSFCAKEAADFAAWKSERLAEPSALSCTGDGDCVVATLGNECAGDCGTGIAKAAAEKLKSDVAAYGKEHCGHCPAVALACPAVVLEPKCMSGKCTTGP